MRGAPSRSRQSKKNTESGSSRRIASTSSLRPNRRIVTWNECGEPSALSAIASPSRISESAGKRAHRLHDFGHPPGHLVQVARVAAHLVARLVDLHARAVELPLEGGRAEQRQRFVDILRRLRQHRQHGLHETDGETREPRRTFGERGACHIAQAACGHHGPAHVRHGQFRGGGNGVDHDSLQRALSQLPDDQPAEKIPFFGRCTVEERRKALGAKARRAFSARRGEAGKSGVHVLH